MSGDPLETIAATDPGEDFEEMCWGLLRRRYPIPDLVRLPATLGGDHGIEGFSKDAIAYQCYADRDSLTFRHRTDKQKPTRDTGKLKKYATELEALLDGLLIENYVLMVPPFHAWPPSRCSCWLELRSPGRARSTTVSGRSSRPTRRRTVASGPIKREWVVTASSDMGGAARADFVVVATCERS
jgi:hypothetical protein